MSTSLSTAAAAQPLDAPPAVPTITVKHTAFSISALVVAVLAFLAAVAAGATTIAHALPAGVPPSVGLWITGIGAVASALSLAIVGGVRAYVYAQKAGQGLFDAPALPPAQLPTSGGS